MKNSDSLSFAGEVKVISIELASHSGKKFDLMFQYYEMSLYEDIFSNTVYGNIMVADSLDMLANMPIIGEEIIYIQYKTPSMSDTIKYMGYVHKVSDVADYADKGKTYLLHFTSFETILDSNKKISKFFNGQVSKVVDDIFHSDSMLGSDKKLNVEETSNQIKFSTPFWSPLKTINHFTSMALTKSKSPTYVFYETLNGEYNFVSLNYLVAPDKKAKLTYRSTRGTTRTVRTDGSVRNMDNEYSLVKSYYIDEMFDYLARLKNGLYSSRLITANTISKTIKVSSIDYLTDFDKTNHLNKYPVLSSSGTKRKNAALNFVVNQEYTYDGQRNLRMDEWLLQRKSLLSGFHDVFRMDIEVNGRTDIHAGDVVYIEIMKSETNNKGETNTDNQNNYYTGRFLIAAINHKFTENKHIMIMQCITDSLGKAL